MGYEATPIWEGFNLPEKRPPFSEDFRSLFRAQLAQPVRQVSGVCHHAELQGSRELHRTHPTQLLRPATGVAAWCDRAWLCLFSKSSFSGLSDSMDYNCGKWDNM